MGESIPDLTNRQIKLISKVLTFVNTVKNCEVQFEIKEFQNIFEKLSEKSLTYFCD